MKNLVIPASVSINGKSSKKCDFRIHDNQLFWHGAPKKYAMSQYDGLIWPMNANLGPCNELTNDVITEKLTNYLTALGASSVEVVEFGDAVVQVEKTSKFEKYGLSQNASSVICPTYKGQPTPEPEPSNEPVAEPVSVPEPSSEPTPLPEPKPVSTPTATTFSAPAPTPQAPSQQGVVDAFAALTPLFAGVEANVVASVMAKMQPIIDKLNVATNTQARVLKVATPNGNLNTVSGATCKNFDAMVQTLAEHEYLYLHGPAGCGKSYTARQLAEALGVKFYAMQQILYAHDVLGFVDAGGKRHETPFSMAYQHGGLCLWDEADGSAEEAAIIVNNALANGIIDLPGIGNVTMHPDFYLVAAGNTTMTGATIEYTARRVLDASTIDRFMFVGMTYDEAIELKKAGGDTQVVEFAHDVRNAIEKAGLFHLCSYRCIQRLGNVNLQAAYGDAELVRSAFVKSLGSDEIRLICQHLQHPTNRWAVALQSLI